MKEPFYHLDYASGECLFKLYLNEILLLDNIEGKRSLAGNILLNPFICKSGSQKLRFELFPKEGDSLLNTNTFIEIYLYVVDQASGFKDREELTPRGTRLPMSTLVNDNKQLIPPPISWNTEFEANVPYSIDESWNNGYNIMDIPEYENKVKAFYKDLYQLVQLGEVVKIKELMVDCFQRTNTTLFEEEENDTYTIFENLIKQRPVAGIIYKIQDLEFGSIRVYKEQMVVDALRRDGSPMLLFKENVHDSIGVSIDIRLFCPKDKNSDKTFRII
ncbi:MAG: hypothetical protein ACK5IQ_05555 [Bacteroidales bacterium]